MSPHVCPWWGGYFIDNPLRRWLHNPRRILGPFVRPGMRVLDFGCGMGWASIAMAQMVGKQGRVLAVDLQPQMLRVLTRRAARVGVAERIATHACRVDSIDLEVAPAMSYGDLLPVDFALAFYSAHEVPDVSRLLREVYGHLRQGGVFLLVEPVGHVSHKAFESMLSTAEAIGFERQERPRVRWSLAATLIKRVSNSG